MALSWWPVAVAGFACLAVAVALAVLLPMERESRQLRPLANTSRLTRLPEYARLARARVLSVIATIVLLTVLFGAAVLASARPTGWWSALGAADPPRDIMLCVGEPATDPSTATFLSHFAKQARTYGTERIGLTSPNRRVVPLTRDYSYAIEKFGDIAEVAGIPDDDALSPAQLAAKRSAVASFSPAVSYVDYATSTADVLALCMTGFPSFESGSIHRRSLIYLGPGELRRPGETRASLFSDEQVKDMASKAGIQINALASPPAGSLREIAESTGGQFIPVDQRSDMAAALGTIRDHPPDASAPAQTVTEWVGDYPTIPLTVAVVASVLLSLALVVLRR